MGVASQSSRHGIVHIEKELHRASKTTESLIRAQDVAVHPRATRRRL
jgi:hypothetical protein